MVMYANVDYSGTKLPDSDTLMVNMGDNLQFLAIDYLYDCAGINPKDVARINMSEIKRGNENLNYRDDFLLLPMNWGIWDKTYMTENNLDVSDNIRIIPLGMCIGGTDGEAFYNEHNKNYYKSISPMGCRDEYSMLKMQKLGIPSYLNGCLTSLLPRLEGGYNKRGKVYFIDAPEEIREYIPQSLLENAVFMTQQCYLPADMSCEEINNQVRKHYEKIKREARLVVTSRLHVASPCMAWGIPVIFAKKVVDHRFGWLDKYLPLYSEEDYANIDWEPQPVEYEKSKQELLDFNIKRITDAYYMYSSAEKITKYYGAPTKRKTYPSFRDTVAYDNKAVYKWLSERFTPESSFSYAIWGISDAAEEVYKKIQEFYPNSKLVAAVDRYKESDFYGHKIQKPEVLKDLENTVVIVLPVKATGEAKKFFDKLRWGGGISCGETYIWSLDAKTELSINTKRSENDAKELKCGIAIYGAGEVGQKICRNLLRFGIQPKAVFDRKAQKGENYLDIPIMQVSDYPSSLCADTTVIIALANGLEHKKVADNLYDYGFRKLVFIPIAYDLPSKLKTELNILYNDYFYGDTTGLVRDYSTYRSELSSLDANQAIVYSGIDNIIAWIPLEIVFTEDLEHFPGDKNRLGSPLSYYDKNIATNYWIINLMNYFQGRESSCETYIRLYERNGVAKPDIEKRRQQFDIFEHEYNFGMDFFIHSATEAMWNKKGYFNIVGGNHRIMYLYSKGHRFFPLRISREDFAEWQGTESTTKEIIEHIKYPVSHPAFQSIIIPNENNIYRVFKSIEEKYGREDMKGKKILDLSHTEGFFARQFARMKGANVTVAVNSDELALYEKLNKLTLMTNIELTDKEILPINYDIVIRIDDNGKLKIEENKA